MVKKGLLLIITLTLLLKSGAQIPHTFKMHVQVVLSDTVISEFDYVSIIQYQYKVKFRIFKEWLVFEQVELLKPPDPHIKMYKSVYNDKYVYILMLVDYRRENGTFSWFISTTNRSGSSFVLIFDPKMW